MKSEALSRRSRRRGPIQGHRRLKAEIRLARASTQDFASVQNDDLPGDETGFVAR
jgi:hypothetical protein